MTPDQLKQIRDSLGLTQTEMANWLGEDVATLRAYQYWESGDRKIPGYVREIIRLKNEPLPMPYDLP